MPQLSAGCARGRRPALVLLLGVTLTLMAHLVACAAHSAEDHRPIAAASTAQGQHHTAGLPLVSADSADCSVTGVADGHPDHDVACCDPAHVSAYLPAPAGTMLLALLLLVLLALRHRSQVPVASGAPPGCEEPPGSRAFTGSALLRIVCVSRT